MLNNDLKTILKGLNIPKSTSEKYFKILSSSNIKFKKQRILRLLKLPKRGVTLYRFFLMYGKVGGIKKWNEYRYKQAYSNSKEYKNMDDEEFNLYNKSRAITKENLILKYGEIEGNLKYENYVRKQKYTKSKQYYIDKYGETEGLKKFNNICKRKRNTKENFISKYGETEGLKRWNNYRSNVRTPYSKIASELFTKLDKTLKTLIFEPKNRELLLESSENYFYYDCFHKESNTIIEFNGDYFHINPKIYSKDNWKPIFNLDYDKIILKDRIKQDFAVKYYRLIVVWESYYKNNKDKCVDEILSLIKSNFTGVKELNI